MKEIIIEILSGEKAGTRLKLVGSKVVFGRLDTCDIILSDASVSRRHAEILYTPPSTYTLKDLNSSNGVFLNNKKISSSMLKNGDIFSIGINQYRFLEKVTSDNSETKNQSSSNLKIPSTGSNPNKKRFIIYGGLGVFLLLLLVFPNSENKVEIKQDLVKEDVKTRDDEFLKELEKDTSYSIKVEEGMEDFFNKANEFYIAGKRELRLNNYTRASDNFKKALTFYPKHAQALYFFKNTIRQINIESEKHLKLGKKLLAQYRYDEAKFHFNEVLNLNMDNPKSNLFKDAEKYIKITEEQSKKNR